MARMAVSPTSSSGLGVGAQNSKRAHESSSEKEVEKSIKKTKTDSEEHLSEVMKISAVVALQPCLRIWAITFNSNIGLIRFKLGWKADSKGYNFVSNDNFLIRTYNGPKVAVK
jgi:hypothetical protein